MTTEKQQTPLQKLIEYIETDEWHNIGIGDILEKAKSLLPEEKQMVIDAHKDGSKQIYGDRITNRYGNQYFNEIFNQ